MNLLAVLILRYLSMLRVLDGKSMVYRENLKLKVWK